MKFDCDKLWLMQMAEAAAKAGWNLGQFRAVLARMADRRECSQ